jgi:hypothetical protein
VKGPAIARTPRPRRQVRPATLRIARLVGFRFDEGRDAYVMRVVGRRFGPVLRAEPYDNAAQSMDWPEQMQERESRRAAERTRTGRFTRDAERRTAERREHSLRH